MALVAGAGYLLGRRRKLRVALVLGSAVAAGRLSRDPRGLLGQGGKALGGAGEVGKLGGLGAPLVAATKAAATSVVTRRVNAVSDGLRRRADRLREPSRAEPDPGTDEAGESSLDADDLGEEYQPDDDYQDEDELDEEPPPVRRRPVRRPGDAAPVRRRSR
jgi:hypothetical protein